MSFIGRIKKAPQFIQFFLIFKLYYMIYYLDLIIFNLFFLGEGPSFFIGGGVACPPDAVPTVVHCTAYLHSSHNIRAAFIAIGCGLLNLTCSVGERTLAVK